MKIPFYKKGILILIIMLIVSLLGCKKEENKIGQFTDTRDGKTYRTIKIGNQVWMAENLDYKTSGSCVYDNDTTNAAIYGRLYDWKTACNVCPIGWHLPSKNEWDILINHLGGNLPDKKSFVGGLLKEKGFVHWLRPNGFATNSSGFTALPGGEVDLSQYRSLGFYAFFWTSTDTNMAYSKRAWLARLNWQDGGIMIIAQTPAGSDYSVRCIKDN